jgi:phage terminase large subunit-like protein
MTWLSCPGRGNGNGTAAAEQIDFAAVGGAERRAVMLPAQARFSHP